MINSLQKEPQLNKKTIGKYKTWELRFKTKKQVSTLIDYNNWIKWRNSDKIIDLRPQLWHDEFIKLIDSITHLGVKIELTWIFF